MHAKICMRQSAENLILSSIIRLKTLPQAVGYMYYSNNNISSKRGFYLCQEKENLPLRDFI